MMNGGARVLQNGLMWQKLNRYIVVIISHVYLQILGFYDLRVPETRKAQAAMAKEYGIEGFIYWHYWFAGKRLLERPFNEVLESGYPDFPFLSCLGK